MINENIDRTPTLIILESLRFSFPRSHLHHDHLPLPESTQYSVTLAVQVVLVAPVALVAPPLNLLVVLRGLQDLLAPATLRHHCFHQHH
jgi:hypothetical protein